MRASSRALLLLGALWFGLAAPPAHAAAPATEQQLKAVFLFNFTHFVAWPADAFATPTDPFVIGILGNDAFAAQVEEAVHDERVDDHPLQVRRLHGVEESKDCKILYVDRTRAGELGRLLPLLNGRDTLTVSDLDVATKRGVMIQLAMEDNRIRLVINPDTARNAGLTISSKLLRLATVARTGN